MDIAKKEMPAARPQAAPALQQEEPQEGGSFTRNPQTGALEKNAPVQPVNQPDQE